jgi:S1-C subfamily serine protease
MAHLRIHIFLPVIALSFAAAIVLLWYPAPPPQTPASQAASASAASSTPPQSDEPAIEDAPAATSTVSAPESSRETSPQEEAATPVESENTAQNQGNTVHRLQNPYATPPLSFVTVNERAREALVNILCMPGGGGALQPIVGSGVMIDPRGVILTNAHVAQYVLLSEVKNLSLRCSVRTGAPASPKWIPRVLYIPASWVEEHAADIRAEKPLGTGAHDYALLYVATDLEGRALEARDFPSLPLDTREAIGFTDDAALATSYPAEFLGPLAAENALYPASTVTSIKDLLTLGTSTVDVLSLGGVIGAQSGSSGGGVVNQWGRLIGIITTTSEGGTTGERDLRAITLSYINRDIATESGRSIAAILAGSPAATTAEFTALHAPRLAKLLLDQLF